MTTSIKVFNVLDYGAVGDGVTDDTSAIQAAIDAAQSLSINQGRGGKVYAPSGLTFKIDSGLVISKPIGVEFNSMINYTPSSGEAITTGENGWQQYYDLYFFGLTNVGGNTSTPSSYNEAGSTGIKINAFIFSRLRVDVIQGFTYCGVWLNGKGDVFSPQIIQHNRFDFGQVVNNGNGIFSSSLDAATSSVEANFFHIENIYQNFFNIWLDIQNQSGATTSNYFLIDAMDNANQAGGGQGMQINGCYNRFDITYLGCNVWFGATSAHNTLNVYNTAATGATYTAGGTSNHYNIAG